MFKQISKVIGMPLLVLTAVNSNTAVFNFFEPEEWALLFAGVGVIALKILSVRLDADASRLG
jgi:hypothetical protein